LDDVFWMTCLYDVFWMNCLDDVSWLSVMDGTSLRLRIMFTNLFKYYYYGFYELLFHILMFFLLGTNVNFYCQFQDACCA